MRGRSGSSSLSVSGANGHVLTTVTWLVSIHSMEKGMSQPLLRMSPARAKNSNQTGLVRQTVPMLGRAV